MKTSREVELEETIAELEQVLSNMTEDERMLGRLGTSFKIVVGQGAQPGDSERLQAYFNRLQKHGLGSWEIEWRWW